MKRKLLWQLFFAFSAIVIISFIFYAAVSFRLFTRFYEERTVSDLSAHLSIAEHILSTAWNSEASAETQAVLLRMGKDSDIRYTVILPNGKVIADSVEDPSLMANHDDRPEIIAAIAASEGGKGVAIRYSPTLKKDFVYVAESVKNNGQLQFVLRVARPLATINEAVSPLFHEVLLALFLIVALAIIISFFVARRISMTLAVLRDGAESFARGEFTHRLPVPPTGEFAQLAVSLNAMAEALDDRIGTITAQKQELETILSSMDEALLMVYEDERVVRINYAAEMLFEVSAQAVAGKPVIGLVHNKQLYEFIREVISSGITANRDVELFDADSKVLHAHGAIVPSAEGSAPRMALFVFSDITHLKRLENIRKEFVANVSHELRTPITAIKGFAETLLDGAIDERENAKVFLETISRQAERLGSIIEELLALSRIERDTDRKEIVLAREELKPILDSAANSYRQRAEKRGIIIEVKCDEMQPVMVNRQLIEQAVGNLVDNAVTYSHDNGLIEVLARREGGEIILSVRDNGIGISSEHLPRLFERFYRVDKARSRKAGGTGLGLSIVKHISIAHGGRVAVESVTGKGSMFSIIIPA